MFLSVIFKLNSFIFILNFLKTVKIINKIMLH